MKKGIIIPAVLVFLCISLNAQQDIQNTPPPLTRILFVFDASQSMYGRWQSDMKINIARKLLLNLLDSLQGTANVELALRAYGSQYNFPPQVCNDTRLLVPFGSDNIPEIKRMLKQINPKGTTPIAYALEQSAFDFPECDQCRNIIVLITDGIEECSGDPCAVSQSLQKKGVVLKPFIIGIGRNFAEAFDCVGTYFDATNEHEFSKALNIVISQALNSTTMQVNLLDSFGKPTETDVNMTFYDNFSGKIRYNFIHTFNHKGFSDTLVIDPLPAYDIVVHTIPSRRADSIILTPGKHTIVPVPAPQGILELKIESRDKIIHDLKCIVRIQGSKETLNVQAFGQTERYITGKYDMEILSLPRIYINNVDIKQSHTTTVEIPVPGIAVIDKKSNGYGSLYHMENNVMVWLYNFRDNIQRRETIVLQPGVYKAVFRSRYVKNAAFTTERTFTVQSGKSVNVDLY